MGLIFNTATVTVGACREPSSRTHCVPLQRLAARLAETFVNWSSCLTGFQLACAVYETKSPDAPFWFIIQAAEILCAHLSRRQQTVDRFCVYFHAHQLFTNDCHIETSEHILLLFLLNEPPDHERVKNNFYFALDFHKFPVKNKKAQSNLFLCLRLCFHSLRAYERPKDVTPPYYIRFSFYFKNLNSHINFIKPFYLSHSQICFSYRYKDTPRNFRCTGSEPSLKQQWPCCSWAQFQSPFHLWSKVDLPAGFWDSAGTERYYSRMGVFRPGYGYR